LKHKSKSYEIIRKTEKGKENQEKIYEKGPGEPFGPAAEEAHGPFNSIPNRYLSFALTR
jgi:hypothetical protein